MHRIDFQARLQALCDEYLSSDEGETPTMVTEVGALTGVLVYQIVKASEHKLPRDGLKTPEELEKFIFNHLDRAREEALRQLNSGTQRVVKTPEDLAAAKAEADALSNGPCH